MRFSILQIGDTTLLAITLLLWWTKAVARIKLTNPNCILKFVHRALISLLSVATGVAQFMPLDVQEMKFRVNANSEIGQPQNSEKYFQYNLDFNSIIGKNIENFIVPSFRGRLSKTLVYNYRFVLTNSANYGPRIGSRYERSGEYTGSKKPGDVSTLESFLAFKSKRVYLQAGKCFPSDFKPGRRDIFNNFQLPGATGFLYVINFGFAKYSHGYFSLGYSSEGDINSGYTRYYATQHLTITFGSNSNEIVIGDRVIYSGINQSVQWKYFTPLEPFLLSTFNFGSPENNDNHAIDIGVVLNNIVGFQLLGNAVIDEFEVDSADRMTNDDDWGLQLRISKEYEKQFLKKIALNSIYTSDYLGIHYSKSTNFEIYGLPIFSEYGPQVKRFELTSYFASVTAKSKGWISIYKHSQGKNSILGTSWEPKANSEDLASWRDVFGVESEILFEVKEKYFIFCYLNIDHRMNNTIQLSLAYSFNGTSTE